MLNKIRPTPWDKEVFGIDTYEIIEISKELLASLEDKPGHYTVKIDPLSNDKALLHTFGFKYCDTIIEPRITKENFRAFTMEAIGLTKANDMDTVNSIIRNNFRYDRFHRDACFSKEAADLRYINWAKQLYLEKSVYEFLYKGKIAGFIACKENALILHALHPDFQNKGLAKYFWTKICNKLFDDGFTTVSSSVSAANLAVVNLYASLGFKFYNARDVYHKLKTG